MTHLKTILANDTAFQSATKVSQAIVREVANQDVRYVAGSVKNEKASFSDSRFERKKS